jgi:hypothetical protein
MEQNIDGEQRKKARFPLSKIGGERSEADSTDTVRVDQDKPAEDERINDKRGNMRRLAEDVLAAGPSKFLGSVELAAGRRLGRWI